jgi:hypothetical protein
MGAKIQASDIFQTPLSSHYPLPLRVRCLFRSFVHAPDNPENKTVTPGVYFQNFKALRLEIGAQPALSDLDLADWKELGNWGGRPFKMCENIYLYLYIFSVYQLYVVYTHTCT